MKIEKKTYLGYDFAEKKLKIFSSAITAFLWKARKLFFSREKKGFRTFSSSTYVHDRARGRWPTHSQCNLKHFSGFSLVELLAVIAIMGILTSILVPMVGHGIKSANRATAASNLRQIALAYASCVNNGNIRDLNASKTANEWASRLADKSGLNDPTLYILKDDYLVTQHLSDPPPSIGSRGEGSWTMNEAFANFPLSFTIISNLEPLAPSVSTPIAYTRGLNPETGKWNASNGENGGVYGTDGGLIVFLDGHVEFFNNLIDGPKKLLKYGTNQSTSDIREAVNPGAKALNPSKTLWTR
ncbi:MAG: hypothetical protein A2007_02240 [Verrucomicrobia bacterium GWC2_42_7]|nr:MAG: hypothetical protein A2007_02240 [Verrucomicrobia bacterium GWC2_42_7]